jgi:deoxyribonuclease V
VSGFLFYREAPIIMPIIRKVMEKGMIDGSTLIVIDGNGRIHPRRSGIACQVGAATNMMTCGIAKRLLCGRLSDWEFYMSGEERAMVEVEGIFSGYASRRNGGRPIYISPGNRISIEESYEALVRTKKGRLPSPIAEAHNEANRCRRSESPSGDL